jgi:2-polyprenyl-3-methyl-5-hydroxy-6-metoxy-1,4-benzoquinol methylase
MSSKILYETEHKKTGYFSFGKNWNDFLTYLNPTRMKNAEESLELFLGGKGSVKDKSFIDIGCGSGIFSLAAHRLGADRVVSVDIDDESLGCVRMLHESESKPKKWQIKKGSALNLPFIQKLGRFDIVYSWGVLHHTGDMYTAIKNVTDLVNSEGQLYIAVYNHSFGLMHGKSTFWLKVKKHYNESSEFVKNIYVWIYSTYLFLGLCITRKNPFRYINQYQSVRGMSWKHDILDWLGGYPYEYAEPSTIINYLSQLGFTLKKSAFVTSIGCNEYVFIRNKPTKLLPAVTVLISVHNSAKTLPKSLGSVWNQTRRPYIVCINDASTDGTASVLKHWQKKMGDQLLVVVNKQNLGLTKSLNKGLKTIKTPYTSRIDADDWWEPDKLEKQLNFLQTNQDYGVIGCWYTNHTHKKQYHLKPPMSDQVIRHIIINQNPFAHSCVIFQTQLIQELGGYDNSVRYGQDYELWLRCLPHTKFFNLPINLCHRSFTGGISIEKQHDQMRSAIRTRLKYIKLYKLPHSSYLSVLEPWLVSLTPRWLADIKRKLSDR